MLVSLAVVDVWRTLTPVGEHTHANDLGNRGDREVGAEPVAEACERRVEAHEPPRWWHVIPPEQALCPH